MFIFRITTGSVKTIDNSNTDTDTDTDTGIGIGIGIGISIGVGISISMGIGNHQLKNKLSVVMVMVMYKNVTFEANVLLIFYMINDYIRSYQLLLATTVTKLPYKPINLYKFIHTYIHAMVATFLKKCRFGNK